jgi:hypothetical protein
MSAASDEEWLVCECANPGCKMTIPVKKVLPNMRDAEGKIQFQVGPGGDRVPCPRCGVTTYYSKEELHVIRHPEKRHGPNLRDLTVSTRGVDPAVRVQFCVCEMEWARVGWRNVAHGAIFSPMPRKPQTPKPLNDPAEYQRFLDMAREVGADESSGAMDRALDKIDIVKPPSQDRRQQQMPSASTKGRPHRDQSR